MGCNSPLSRTARGRCLGDRFPQRFSGGETGCAEQRLHADESNDGTPIASRPPCPPRRSVRGCAHVASALSICVFDNRACPRRRLQGQSLGVLSRRSGTELQTRARAQKELFPIVDRASRDRAKTMSLSQELLIARFGSAGSRARSSCSPPLTCSGSAGRSLDRLARQHTSRPTKTLRTP